jgi:hypothetical protein
MSTVNRVAAKPVFAVFKVSGPMSAPKWEKVGKAFWGPEGKAKAEEEAKKLAMKEGTEPTARFYVLTTVAAFRAPPKNPVMTARTYGVGLVGSPGPGPVG